MGMVAVLRGGFVWQGKALVHQFVALAEMTDALGAIRGFSFFDCFMMDTPRHPRTPSEAKGNPCEMVREELFNS